MHVKVASSLGLLRDNGSVATFSTMIDVPVTFELLEKEQRLRLTKMGGFNAYKLILPVNRDRFIWNLISEHSFQMLVVGLDIMKPTFTGTEMSRTLCTVAVNPLKSILHYKPKAESRTKKFKKNNSKICFLGKIWSF